MRATRLLLGLGTSFTVVAAVAAGCGGSTNNPSTPQDSGTADVTTEAAAEAEPEAAPEAAPDVMEAAADVACVPDATIQQFSLPDAAVGDGGNSQACLSCFENACPMIVMACNASCACVSAYETFANCITTSPPGLSSLAACGMAFATNSGGIITGVSQLTCALGCAGVCGVTIPTGDGGGDTGTTGDSSAGD